MQRIEFEQAILEMSFEVGYEHLTPASVAYYLRMPIKQAEHALDELVEDGVLDLESDGDGRFYYALPIEQRPSTRVIEQTVLRRAATGLGSEFSARQIAARDGNTEPVIIRERAAGGKPIDPEHPLVLPDPPNRAAEQPLHEPVAHVEHGSLGELVVWEDPDADLVAYEAATNPAVPMLLSFFWPGLGQIHNGQPGKGLVMFFTSALLWLLFLGWAVTIYSVIDAGVVASSRREEKMRNALPAS